MKAGRLVSWLYVGLVLAFLFTPAIVVITFSFNSVNSNSELAGLSVRWYKKIFSEEEFRSALTVSLEAAVFTALVVIVAGTLAATAMARLPRRVTSMLSAFFTVPIILPGLLVGVMLLVYFSGMGVPLGMPTIVVGHVLITLPFVIVVMSTRLERLDPSLFEAARDLGANGLQAFYKVLLPLIAPALVASALLAVAWSLDEFIITLFTNGGIQTVPVFIFALMKRGLDPSVNAIAAVLVAGTTAAVVIAARFVSLSEMAD